jgi:hypothetical protein
LDSHPATQLCTWNSQAISVHPEQGLMIQKASRRESLHLSLLFALNEALYSTSGGLLWSNIWTARGDKTNINSQTCPDKNSFYAFLALLHWYKPIHSTVFHIVSSFLEAVQMGHKKSQPSRTWTFLMHDRRDCRCPN